MEEADKLFFRSSSAKGMTPEMGLRVGYALAQDYHTVLVGSDLQNSSFMMKNALISALISSGSDVIDAGEVSAPAFAFEACNADCAVYVTEYRNREFISGYVLLNPNGGEFTGEQMRSLEIIDETRKKDHKQSESLGIVKYHHNATRNYISRFLSMIPSASVGSLVLNCNCGVATDSAPLILSSMNTDTISLNAQKDSNYNADALSIKEADTRHMKAFIESSPGCIGISINRIGTILRAFDEEGDPISYDHILALIVLYLKPKLIVLPMDTTALIEDIFTEKVKVHAASFDKSDYGGEPQIIYRPPFMENICESLNTEQHGIGYFDRRFIYNNICLCPDAIHTAAVLAGASGVNNLRAIIDSLPIYYKEKKSYKILCPPDKFLHSLKVHSIEAKAKVVSEDYYIRVIMDGGWFFVSFDNEAEDKVNVVIESNDKLYLVSLMDVIEEIMDKCINGQ